MKKFNWEKEIRCVILFNKAIGEYLDYKFGRKKYENVYYTVVLDIKYTYPYGKPSKY